MADKPQKRPWFQIHLSTAVVLMFVAGGLTWANCRSHGFMWNDPNFVLYGFPYIAIKPKILCALTTHGCEQIFLGYNVEYPIIAVDLTIAMVILFFRGSCASGGYVAMANEHKKRPWFQIHLSTAIVLMFVAGGIMWANVFGNEGFAEIDGTLSTDSHDHYIAYGWPYCAAILSTYRNYLNWFYWDICKNIAVAFSMLFVMWFVCEWRITRSAKG